LSGEATKYYGDWKRIRQAYSLGDQDPQATTPKRTCLILFTIPTSRNKNILVFHFLFAVLRLFYVTVRRSVPHPLFWHTAIAIDTPMNHPRLQMMIGLATLVAQT
jgi:hypothetical protein